jgi:hypothetical protein
MTVRITLLAMLVASSVAHAEGLDRAAISSGIAGVKAKVALCGDANPKASGKVKARVTVAPEGKVSGVSIEATPDPKLGSCVADALKKASFKKTGEGGSFSYPFVFTAKDAPPASPPPGPVAPPSAPTTPAKGLDRTAISEGIAKVKSKITGCGTANPSAKGKVKAKVIVAPAGAVTSAEIEATPDPKLGTCVADVLKSATFAKTEAGGSFSYPFVF